MRGKSKINVLLFLGPNWNLQGKKKIGGLSIDNSNSNENVKKAIGLIIMKQNNGFACSIMLFVQFFLPLHANKVKLPNETFLEDVNASQQLPFSFSELGYSSCRIHIPKHLPKFDELSKMEYIVSVMTAKIHTWCFCCCGCLSSSFLRTGPLLSAWMSLISLLL